MAAGRCRDRSEAVQAGLTLPNHAEAELAELVASLEEARAEGEREGFLSAKEVHREITAMLDEMARCKASVRRRS